MNSTMKPILNLAKATLIRVGLAAVGFFFAAAAFGLGAGTAQAATNGRMLDDSVFDASGTMSAADIQTFLNGFPNSCLKNYTDEMPSADPMNAYFNYSGSGSAAQIIRRVADNWGINPRLLLTKLQQESSLVNGNAGCDVWRFRSAVGFNCPGPVYTQTYQGQQIQTCVQNVANIGFSRQLSKGGWLLKWAKERATGNLNWLVADDGTYTYTGPYTQGNRQNCRSCQSIYRDGYWNGVYLESAATASLYNYTPFLNQSFDEIWEGWWGAGSVYAANYAWSYVSQTADRDLGGLASGQAAVLVVVVRNTGNITWVNSGNNPIRLAPSRPNDRASRFSNTTWIAPHRVGTMQEASVAPGQNATFSFFVQAPLVSSLTNFREDFRLLIEGLSWLPDIDLHYNFRVSPPQFLGTITAGGLPTALNTNDISTINLSIRNDGNVSWYKGGKFPVRIGTLLPYNYRSVFDAGSWISASRPAGLQEIEVAPGQVGTFSFAMRAPNYDGRYLENLSLVAEGLSWFKSPILSTQVGVSGGQANELSKIRTGQALVANTRLVSPNGKYRLEMQGDGNLVVYTSNRASWYTGTFSNLIDRLVLQSDGNLVMYDAQGKYYWATMTDSGSYLSMQDDGNLVLYRADGYPLWHTIR